MLKTWILALNIVFSLTSGLTGAPAQSETKEQGIERPTDQASEAAQWSAVSREALGLLQTGRFTQAEALLKSAATQFRKPQFLSYTLNSLGCLYAHAGDYDRSEMNFRAAIANSEDLLQNGNAEALTPVVNLLDLYLQYGQSGKAQRFVGQLDRLAPHWASTSHVSTARLYYLAGTLELVLGRFSQAEPLLIRADELFGTCAVGRSERFMALNNLAMLYRFTDRLDRALTLARAANQLASSQHEDRSGAQALVLINLALIERQTRNAADAQLHFEQGMQVAETTVDRSSPKMADILFAGAEYLKMAGRRREGKQLQHRAQLVREAIGRSTSLGKTVEYSSLR